MKAVILAGGLGTRMREETEYRPKPMVEIGGKPILWHIMKFFSSQGIDEFLILVGYRGDQIKRYFLEFAAQNSDFTISTDKLNQVQLHANASGDQADAWKVTVVDTGRDSLTGKRLSLAASYVGDEDFFLTYGDGVSNVDLAALRDSHNESQALVTISIGHPVNRFGVVEANEAGMVTKFTEKPNSRDKVNIGYMVCSPNLLKFIEGDEALEQGPLVRLSEQGLLHAYEHPGFFYAMDTLRDQEQLEKMWNSGKAEWATWK